MLSGRDTLRLREKAVAVVELKGEAKVRYVAEMFRRIAARYDRLNAIMTLGMHRRWRRLAARLAAAGLEGDALDIATGTGDLALALLQQPRVHQAVGLDLVAEMLHLAHAKAMRQGMGTRLTLVQGDALRLPFVDGRFACATSGFSMRNVADLEGALREMVRVVRPGGRVVILELTPTGVPRPLRQAFRWYFRRVTPLLGALLAGDREAYTYLPQSVEAFPDAEALARLMSGCGLQEVRRCYLGMGTVALHVGQAP